MEEEVAKVYFNIPFVLSLNIQGGKFYYVYYIFSIPN